jgi:phage protein U
MAKIGNFIFEIDNKEFDNLKRSFSFDFASNKTLASHPNKNAIGAWDETIVISGKTIKKKMSSFDELIKIAKSKLPQLFVCGNGEILGRFLIKKIDLDRKYFLKDGSFIQHDFSIELERYFN